MLENIQFVAKWEKHIVDPCEFTNMVFDFFKHPMLPILYGIRIDQMQVTISAGVFHGYVCLPILQIVFFVILLGFHTCIICHYLVTLWLLPFLEVHKTFVARTQRLSVAQENSQLFDGQTLSSTQ